MKIKRKIFTVLLHLLAWAVVLVGPLSSVFYQTSVGSEIIWYSVCVVLILLAEFYINYYLLIPKLLFKKKFILYFLLVIVLAGSVFVLNGSFHKNIIVERRNGELVFGEKKAPLVNPRLNDRPSPQGDNHRPPEHTERLPRRENQQHIQENMGPRPQMRQQPPPFLFAPLFMPGALVLFLMISIAIRTTGRWYDEDRKNKLISAEQLETELAFLKNQISPHFFFNTLNNIYALTESDPEQAKEITYKLSKLMRYLLYESDKNQSVSLKMEISFLENYIDLMRPRLPENVKITTKFEVDRTMDQIPPLLFITFVENAFKHGVSTNKPAFIDINLYNTEGKIVFIVKNSIPASDNLEKGKGGLGLTNIKRRLELLFDKDVYSLKIDDSKERYFVELIFPINEN